jgi:hypothetical protein
MKAPDAFSPEQVREIARVVREGAHPFCPRCGVRLDERAVPPRPDVSYVRDRVWLVCPSCRRTTVVDRR